MRVVVTGASGNVGSALLRRLATEDRVEEIVGFARRRPDVELPKVRWVTGDLRDHDLVGLFHGAAAVVHLAWLLQPSRDRGTTHAVNVDGTERVLEAVAAAGVGTVVVASSVAAYGPGPSGDDGVRVDETWPTTGVPTSFYSREKVAVEGLINRFEEEHSAVRIVRMRPGLIFQRSAAQQIRRLFLGPLFPNALVRPHRMPLAPVPRGLRLQVVHADDVAEAYRLAILRPDAHGAYNVAADPVIDGARIRQALGGLPVPVPQRVLRATAKLTWKARLQPTPPGWVDLGLQSPLMETARLRALGWEPQHDGTEALFELLAGLRDGSGGATPPLRADAGGRFRMGEFRSGVGARSRG
jgi:nucleoside-diphosphate-sugar epimerase